MSESDSSLEKGLAILEVMSCGGPIRIRDIHAQTGYSKPTIVRLLQVMEARGYVTRIERNAGYCLSSRVLALSDGFDNVSRLIEASAPSLDAFTERRLWPAAMAVLDFDHMIVRYSTISTSPLSHKNSTMSRRLSMLHRAHGRAYLAFCPSEERERIFHRLDKSGRELLEPHLGLIRKRGWAERDLSTEPQTNTIAVPVLSPADLVIATIGVTFFRSSITEDAKAELAEDLIELTQQIVARFNGISSPGKSELDRNQAGAKGIQPGND